MKSPFLFNRVDRSHSPPSCWQHYQPPISALRRISRSTCTHSHCPLSPAMVRPFPFLATCLMLLALAFLIIAASTAHWLVSYQSNVQEYEGVYNACWRQHDVGIDECRHVNNDCTADFSSPVDSFTLTDSCNELRAVRAFVVLAIIFAGLAVVALYLLSFTKVSRHSSRTQHSTPLIVTP